MRHLNAHRKLGRTSEHRNSMLRNLVTSLINARDERIVTTLPKAKELRPFIERVITLSRRAQGLEGDDAVARSLHLRRQAAAFFHTGNQGQTAAAGGRRGQPRPPRTAGVAALKRLFDELGERYKDRPGGYTRIIKLGRRDGDNAELAIIELVDNPREREAAASTSKRAKSVTSGKKKSAKASETKEAAGGRRGGRNAPKAEASGGAGSKETDKAGSGGRRSKKTESTAAEKDTEK
ncbi:MAG TPA: 50S ribosomal protein L17 [Pyrinomonadaceae bacterium]